MKLTVMSQEVFDIVKNAGGKISIPEIAEQTGRTARSVGANVTDLTKKELASRVKETVGDDEITYVVLTDAGMNFVPTEE